MPIIETRDLVREYYPGRGVSGVTLSIESGECFGLLGRNGSGKSSFTRLILGLERPSSGTIRVLGHDLGNSSRRHLLKIGFALDRSVHWEDLSGFENAFFFARSYGMPIGEIQVRLEELFDLADLSERKDDPVKDYSYGMRQKLSLIEALCHDPELLVLDEPSRGLDPHFLNRLRDLVRLRTRKGQTTWIAGNDPDWISGLTTNLAFMDSGRILAQGTEEDLTREVSSLQRVTIHLLHPREIDAPDMEGVRSFDQSDGTVALILGKDPMLVPAVLEWIVSRGGSISRLEVSQGTLRDAFLLRTGRTLEQ